MNSICFYFQVHQPFRLGHYNFDQIGKNDTYENINQNKDLIDKFADKTILPTNTKILNLIKKTGGRFKVSFSISGTAMEQFEQYRPDVIKSFKALVNTGSVELLATPYYNSLSSLYSKEEFARQVQLHTEKMKKYFDVTPKVFSNTELVFSNDIAEQVSKMGFTGMLCEGVDHIIGNKNPNQVFVSARAKKLNLLLKNRSLSEDISSRFSDSTWIQFPLSAPKYANWINSMKKDAKVINLFMDYKTFGDFNSIESGIFGFFDNLPEEILKGKAFEFATPSELFEASTSKETYDVSSPISWGDSGRDLSDLLENKMQLEAMQKLFSIEKRVLESKNKQLISNWGRLQTIDHLYNMSLKSWSSENTRYPNPYGNPYDAHIYFMNILSDIEVSLPKPAVLPVEVKASKTKTAPAKKEVVKKEAVVPAKKTIAPKKEEKAPSKKVAAKPVIEVASTKKKVATAKKEAVKATAVKVKKAPAKVASSSKKTPAKAVKAEVKKPAVATKKATPAKKAAPIKKEIASVKASSTKKTVTATKNAKKAEVVPAKKTVTAKKVAAKKESPKVESKVADKSKKVVATPKLASKPTSSSSASKKAAPAKKATEAPKQKAAVKKEITKSVKKAAAPVKGKVPPKKENTPVKKASAAPSKMAAVAKKPMELKNIKNPVMASKKTKTIK